MNAPVNRRDFTAVDARREEVPLLVGLTGPSGSGKTFSALRLATGIQQVYGGDIYGVDTESRRMLHYADKFRFKHVPFGAPFGSLDYLEAIRFCVREGAGVIVIDSCSHEHDGPGGLLEQHEAELTRLAGDQEWKRESMNMMAWQKPKTARRQMINAITTDLSVPIIFCFRAKTTAKPGKVQIMDKHSGEPTGRTRNGVIDMGLTPIAGDEWVFEMTLNALLKPGSRGVPTWESDKPGELQAIKLPEQFLALAEQQRALNEAVGSSLAKWAKGEVSAKRETPSTRARFQAVDTRPSDDDDGQHEPEAAPDGEEGAETPLPGDGEQDMFDAPAPPMVDRILAEVAELNGAHAANDYERAQGRMIADLSAPDSKRVKAALQAKRTAGR